MPEIWNLTHLPAVSTVSTKSLIQLRIINNKAKGSTSGGTVRNIKQDYLPIVTNESNLKSVTCKSGKSYEEYQLEN